MSVLLLGLAACDSPAGVTASIDAGAARDVWRADAASPLDAGHGTDAGQDADSDVSKSWRRNTFPGPGHENDPGFPPGQGSDRSEWMYYFKVSPVDPTFMLINDNMGSGYVSRDGRMFEPVDSPRHKPGTNVTFCPHDGKTAYAIQGQVGAVGDSAPYSGIWRTRDKGKTWTQIYARPSSTPSVKGPSGKNELAVDPHPGRAGHLYFASNHRGLVRSVDDGQTWQVVAFPGLPIKTLAAAKGPANSTVLYVIVGAPGGPTSKQGIVAQGALWRVEVAPSAPFELKTFKLPGPDNFIDVEIHPNDWSRGMLIRDQAGNLRGGTQLVAFEGGGTKIGVPRTAAQASVACFVDVHINPQDPDHVVVRSQGSTSVALQYSRDGGKTWNKPHGVVNGHVPDIKSFNPAHHDAPKGEMRQTSHQGQGSAVGFDANDPDVVYWWTQNFDKTPLRSTDHGATFKPFAYGGPFKQALQIALASDAKHRGVGRAEYGFVTTRNGGLAWTGSTYATDPVLAKKTTQGGSWGAKAGWGLAYNPDDPNTLVGIYGESPPSIFISTDGGQSWKDTGGETGSTGCVYWHQQQPSVVYAANQRSLDGGKSWSAMDRLVLAVSTSNGDVLVGNSKIGSNDLFLSLDRGETWAALPALPQAPVSGMSLTNHVTIAHAVAIDPDPARDPTKSGGKGVRILVAGRAGIYELSGGSGSSAAKGSWTVFDKGFEPSIHTSDNMPYVAHVVFDPRPGFHHVVYAAKSWDPVFAAKWRGKGNRHGQARRPLCRSVDGGKSWSSLHAPVYRGIPDHLDVMDIAVDQDGTLFVDGYGGLYSLSAD